MFYTTQWFCILKLLKSLKNAPKSLQITREVPKGMYIFWLGLAKKKNSSLPHPLLKPRETPHTSNGPTVAVFRFKSENKKHISGHN